MAVYIAVGNARTEIVRDMQRTAKEFGIVQALQDALTFMHDKDYGPAQDCIRESLAALGAPIQTVTVERCWTTCGNEPD